MEASTVWRQLHVDIQVIGFIRDLRNCDVSHSKTSLFDCSRTGIWNSGISLAVLAPLNVSSCNRIFEWHLAGFRHHNNCAELYKSGERANGVYTIDPDGTGPLDVFCDQTTAGGGWIVFQKRLDGSADFYRGWTDYKVGFGNLNGEFWLGLDKINRLTKTGNRLRVDLEDTTGKAVYAEYDMLAVTSERTKYKLSLGTYSGKSKSLVFFIIKYLRLNVGFSANNRLQQCWGSVVKVAP